MTHTVTVIPGDGIGPEIVRAARQLIEAAGVQIHWEECEAGAAVFKKGISSGVPEETIASIQRTRTLLKGPLETPIGFGEKSANVTLRKYFETFANIRPIKSFPGVPTPYQDRSIDFVIIRENIEDLYAGIEYRQTPGVAQCLQLMSRKGCEKIIRLAFEFARAEGRKKVHCATKSNIMKMTEGTFKKTFEEIAPEYPDIQAEHIITDNCAHQLVRFPEKFDVIVLPNMAGDILSDLSSGLIGGLGFASSANLGHEIAFFEAVHGSAPKYAGKNVINPSSLILASVMMLRHLGELEAATNIEQALFLTLEEGLFTQDVKGPQGALSTTAFTQAIQDRLGKRSSWSGRTYQTLKIPARNPEAAVVKVSSRELRGVDIFIEANLEPTLLGQELEKMTSNTPFELRAISCRGVKVYPPLPILPDVVDHWRCRFMARPEVQISQEDICELLKKLSQKYTWMHVEKLNLFDNQAAYSKMQGED